MIDDFNPRSRVRDEAEARMRQSLGVGPATNTDGRTITQRKRFVRDGEVRVEVVRARPESETRHAAELTALNNKLVAEQEARQQAERALAEARVTIQSLRTHLAHAEMALAERTAQAVAAAAAPPPPAKPRATAKPAGAPEREPKPVKWWTAAYKVRKQR